MYIFTHFEKLKMDGKKSKSEMLTKIAAMKQELARKEKKLKKSMRVASIKAHVQQKLKEFNNHYKGEGLEQHLESSNNIMSSASKNKKSPTAGERKSPMDTLAVRENGDGSVMTTTTTTSTKDKDAFMITDPRHRNVPEKISGGEGDGSAMTFSRNSGEKCPCKSRSCEENSVLNLERLGPEIQKGLNNKIYLQLEWESNRDDLNFESQAMSPAFKSQGRNDSSMKDQDKGDNDLSNSQFLELLGLSQPISLTPAPMDVQKEKKMGRKVSNHLSTTCVSPECKEKIRNHTTGCVYVNDDDNDSQSAASHITFDGSPNQKTMKNQTNAQVDKALDARTSTLYEYTELDAISYSQFELTEDFLSENASSQSDCAHLQRKVKRSSLTSLIKRKSPRLSSFSYSSTPFDITSQSSSSESGYYKSKKFVRMSNRKGQRLAQEKAVAVLSAFQYLIEEAKRQADKEFELPCSFQRLRSHPNKLFLSTDECTESANNENTLKENSCESPHPSCQNLDKNESEFDEPKSDRNIRDVETVQEISSNSETVGPDGMCLSLCDSEDTLKPVRCNSQPHSLDNIAQAKPCGGEMLTLDHQHEGIVHKEPSHLLGNENSNAKTDPSFISNSICLKTRHQSPKRHNVFQSSDDCVRIKSAKMSPKEDFSNKLIEFSGNSPSSDVSTNKENAEDIGDNVSLREYDYDDNAKLLNNSLLLKKDLKQSAVIHSCQNHPCFQEIPKSPKPSEILKKHFSSYQPSSSSTPISNIKSRFKSSYKNITGCQPHSNFTEISPRSGKPASQSLARTITGVQHEKVQPIITSEENSRLQKMDEENASIELFNATNTFMEDTLPSGQNILKHDISTCDNDDAGSICNVSLVTSPISKWPDKQFRTGNDILPWKTISRTPFTPLRVLEKESSFSISRSFPSPTFIYGKPEKRDSLPRPIRHDSELKGRAASLHFAGCFQSCSEDSVVQLLHCQAQAEQGDDVVKIYLVSVQASALTVWAQDVDGCGWIPELDWRLSPNIHILEACSLPQITDKIGIAAYGWEDNQFFATVFVYDVSCDVTNRFNLPVVEKSLGFKNPREIHFCCISSSYLLMGISCTADHTIRSVQFEDRLQSVASTSLFKPCRGTLQALAACPDVPKACFGLTGDQRIVIWNIEIGTVLKSIQMTAAIPCLTSLLAVAAKKGFLILTVSWRSEKSDCGGIVLLNPITGKACQYCVYKNPNSGWKSIQAMKVLNRCVVAVNTSGSVCWWNHRKGTVLGHRKSNSATCATLLGAKSVLIGEVQGCVHIYSQEA